LNGEPKIQSLVVYDMDISGNIGFAFVLIAIAGLSTGIGCAIAYFIKVTA